MVLELGVAFYRVHLMMYGGFAKKSSLLRGSVAASIIGRMGIVSYFFSFKGDSFSNLWELELR